jgi:vacuolar-type H+-ATPase subunit H
MTNEHSSQPGGTTDEPRRATDELRHRGEEVIGATQRDAERVVRHAGEEAGAVVDTARREVRDVVDEAVTAVRHETDERTRQAGSALHDLSRDLHRMAADDGERSPAAEYIDAIANTLDRLAGRLDEGSSSVVDSIRSTAERRPGSFVTGSALAGFVVGRIIRNGDRPSTGQPRSDEATPSEIDLRDEPRGPSRSSTERVDPFHEGSDLTSVGAGRPSSGSIPPPPPPGVRPERF